MKAIVTCLALNLSLVALLAAESVQQPHPQSTGNPPATADRSDPNDTTSAPVRQGPRQLKPAEHGVGRMVPDVDFQDIEGQRHRLSELRSHELTVVAVTSTSCPISKRYLPTLAQLEKSYGARKVAFIFVNPTPSDSDEDIHAAIQAYDLRGPYVRDPEGKLLEPLGATTTAECFVLDRARTLVYRGAVDDQYGFGYALDSPRSKLLANALDALLADRSPAVAATDAPGCALDFQQSPAPEGNLTYHNRISRLLQSHCVECHRDGGVAPFSLTTYEDVQAHGEMVEQVVARGVMPPWFAAPLAKGETSPWANDRSLAVDDKADLLAWLASNRPVGDPQDAPLPRTFPVDWQIGRPDAVVQLPAPIAIKATGTMPYQNVTVETDFQEDKWVQAYEIQPTARDVVHHVLVFVRAPGESLPGPEDEGIGGYFAIYVPGNAHQVFADGFAKRIPAGARLRFQIHYTPSGTATQDQLRIGFVFAKEPPRHSVNVAGLANTRLAIPPQAANHRDQASITVPWDATLLGFVPHMHLRGKACRYEATFPDGTNQVLLDIPRYDFNWQLRYELAEPLAIPRGTRLVFTAWYDNSDQNPANPDPNKTVRWGPQTFDEMLLGYVEYYTNDPRAGESLGPRGGAAGVDLDAAFRRLDRNGDDKVTADELPVNQRDRLMRLDIDRDGAITREEANRLIGVRKRKP